MSDMSSAAWASPGGILAGARDLGSAFLQYPVQLAQVRQQREQQEYDRAFRGDQMDMQRQQMDMQRQRFAMDQEAFTGNQRRQHIQDVREGNAQPSDIPAAFQGVSPELWKTQAPLEDLMSNMAQSQGYPASIDAEIKTTPAPTFEMGVADEGVAARAGKQRYNDAMIDAMTRGKAPTPMNPLQYQKSLILEEQVVAAELGLIKPEMPDAMAVALNPTAMATYKADLKAYNDAVLPEVRKRRAVRENPTPDAPAPADGADMGQAFGAPPPAPGAPTPTKNIRPAMADLIARAEAGDPEALAQARAMLAARQGRPTPAAPATAQPTPYIPGF